MAVLDIIARLKNEASGPAKDLAKDLGVVDKAADGGNKSVGGMGKELKIMGAIAGPAAGVMVALAAGVNATVNAAAEAEVVHDRLAQTIENQGLRAGVTIGQVDAIAASYKTLAAGGDEAVLSGQNLLVGMVNLDEQGLKRASIAMLDLATKMGGTEASAQFLARALAEPEQAAGKLEKQGIFLTQQQQAQIKAFTAAGDAAAAQGVILDAVSAVYGGQALAASKTYEGQTNRLTNATGDLAEAFGEGLLPRLTEAKGAMARLVESVTPAVSAQSALRLAVDEGAITMTRARIEWAKMVFTGHEAADVMELLEGEMADLEAANLGYIAATSQAATVTATTNEQLNRLVITSSTGEDIVLDLADATYQAADAFEDEAVAIAHVNNLGRTWIATTDEYGRTAGQVEDAQLRLNEAIDSGALGGEHWARVIEGITSSTLPQQVDALTELHDAYGDLEAAGGEWVTTTLNNNGRIATANEQLMGDLDEDTKKGYQEILNTAVEGGAEWLAAYQALQGDLTQAQRIELVAQIADLQAHQGDARQVYTGNAEDAEAAQERINIATEAITTGYEQMVLDMIIADAGGVFTAEAAEFAVAAGLMEQGLANARLESQRLTTEEFPRLYELSQKNKTSAEDLAEAAGFLATGLATTAERALMMADNTFQLAQRIGAARDRTSELKGMLEEAEGSYDINLNYNINTTGNPPTIPGGGGGFEPYEQAEGGDWLVTRPTLFLAGEAGPERATFTPLGGGQPAGTTWQGGDTINVNIAIDARYAAPGMETQIERVVEVAVARALSNAGRMADSYRRMR